MESGRASEWVQSLLLQYHLIDWRRAEGLRRRADDRFARDVDAPAGGKVHDGIGAVLHREDEGVDLVVYKKEEETAEFPMFALTLTEATLPMAMGSRAPSK